MMAEVTEEPKATTSFTEGKMEGKRLHDSKHGDVALRIFDDENELVAAIDPAVERRVIRKIDMMVMPFICITYLMTYLDKATLGYAAVFDLQKDLSLHGTQYSWLGSIFYFGYLVVRVLSPQICRCNTYSQIC